MIIAGILLAVYCFLLSDSGLVARLRLVKEREDVQSRIQKLGAEKKQLSKLLERYRQGEFLKEEALKSGFIGNNERFLIFRGKGDNQEQSPFSRESRPYEVELVHLKLLWVVLSLIILMFYIIRKKRYSTS